MQKIPSPYTIARILEVGDPGAVAWMMVHFTEEAIKEVIRRDPRLTPRSANYWALIYEIPPHDVAAIPPSLGSNETIETMGLM